jgi:iron(III) transport system substrate-binding protein
MEIATRLRRSLVVAFGLLLTGEVFADWEKEWNELLSRARREGKIVVAGWSDPNVRRELPARFTARFGIPVEYIGGRTGDHAARLRTERQAGLYTIDVVLGGIDSMATILHREKMLDPLKPSLILPEVTDPSKWRNGKLWFIDPEEIYILRLFNYVTGTIHINTQHVRPGDIRSVRDLIDPKWKGKISAHDPTVTGSGNTPARFYIQFGDEFVRRLYVDQKPVMSRDRRQMADWLARGTYPISLDASSDDVRRLQSEGFPVMTLYRLPDLAGMIAGSFGLAALMNRAPHPNGAKVFLNWLASKEGLEVYARAGGTVPARNDIDASSFVPEEEIPLPGANYFDTYDWQYTVMEREKARLRLKELLKR